MTVNGCGDATVCLQSGWIEGAQIDGQTYVQPGGVLVFGDGFGTSSWKAVVNARLDGVVSGDATVTATQTLTVHPYSAALTARHA